jgi:hypothetical protein
MKRPGAPVDPAALRKFVDAALAEALDRLGYSGTKPKGRSAPPSKRAPRSHPANPADPDPSTDQGESGEP